MRRKKTRKARAQFSTIIGMLHENDARGHEPAPKYQRQKLRFYKTSLVSAAQRRELRARRRITNRFSTLQQEVRAVARHASWMQRLRMTTERGSPTNKTFVVIRIFIMHRKPRRILVAVELRNCPRPMRPRSFFSGRKKKTSKTRKVQQCYNSTHYHQSG